MGGIVLIGVELFAGTLVWSSMVSRGVSCRNLRLGKSVIVLLRIAWCVP